MSETAVTRRPRQANWDVLRGLSMLLVVAAHTLPMLPRFQGPRLGGAVAGFCMVCNPIFFMLSGYFAIRPLRGSLGSYVLRKASSVLAPLVVYSLVLYVATSWSTLSPGGYLACLLGYLRGGWWFVPALVPFLLHYYLVLGFLGTTSIWAGAAALVSSIPLPAGVALAVLVVLGVFALTLLVASVLDPLVLTPAQRLFDHLAAAVLTRLEKRDVA